MLTLQWRVMLVASNQHKKGFTIVELLIVIVVIGILATIIIVAFNGVQARAKKAMLQNDLREAHQQLAIEQVNNGQYPSTAANLKKSDETEFQYSKTNDTYCLTATTPGADPLHVTQSGEISDDPCSGHFSSVIASGGSISEVQEGDTTWRVHTFTQSGTFKVKDGVSVEYLVVAGGGSGTGHINNVGGGGGAGGVITSSSSLSPGSFNITIGAGGIAKDNNGENTSFGSLATAIGGGAGGTGSGAHDGGSGGGAGQDAPTQNGSGTSGQGNDGGITDGRGGGGGGAGGPGDDAIGVSGNGGPGIEWPAGSGNYYGGGGGGSQNGGGSGHIIGEGGIGGGGYGTSGTKPAASGAPNTGGGGGSTRQGVSGDGGSGIVIIRYKV